uniref:Yip1 domain-containing protein n=1 Tax=Candidatus Methanogaster sp. ANME-2c ERB4 TaxID=2759911 RepID=A0A7G9Y2L9_9EURY|nr:hypothetical protein LDHBDEKG_00004 [Methanosarcinales archaeon ANME-2c ERB4]QNO43053.1 hypothetical protein HGKCJMEE_00031 [Methanosarcinales archaeon ANME-2c ERB4]QNO43182.1 hypothetical protein CEGDBGHB_00004 [Methanosarcinales archaeon ANME-2c ERB4]QNO45349.1 hypothetical protein IOFJOFCH_00009 [Methanosarcinales archaeon ANME-2c ERB4]QNO45679.1 hypothetical protein BOCBCOEP_00008 [Methanosarcinales archaeon ANME-2c ERB4]
MKGFLFSPSATFDASKNDTVSDALKFLILILPIFPTVLIFVIATSPGEGITIKNISSSFLVVFIFVIGGIFSAYSSGLWTHVWVYLLGGRAGAEQTLKATIYSKTPIWLLGGVGFVAGAWAASKNFDSFGMVIAATWFLFMSIWAYITEIIGIRQLHGLSTGIAILAATIPITILVIIGMCLNL